MYNLSFFVSFVLAILVAFASTLFYNVIIEPDIISNPYDNLFLFTETDKYDLNNEDADVLKATNNIKSTSLDDNILKDSSGIYLTVKKEDE